MHSKKERIRGFNQALLIAQTVSKKLAIPILNNFLIKTRPTKPQMKVKRKKERSLNLAGTYQIKYQPDPPILDKKILLIDDVVTTGSTFMACAQPLKALGFKKIFGLAIAVQVVKVNYK